MFLSSSLQSPAMYQVQMPHMTVSQSKPYRPGKGEKDHVSSRFLLDLLDQLARCFWSGVSERG